MSCYPPICRISLLGYVQDSRCAYELLPAGDHLPLFLYHMCDLTSLPWCARAALVNDLVTQDLE